MFALTWKKRLVHVRAIKFQLSKTELLCRLKIKGLKDTIMNQTCHLENEGSLKITFTINRFIFIYVLSNNINIVYINKFISSSALSLRPFPQHIKISYLYILEGIEKDNNVEDKIHERGLYNPQISSVGSWNQRRRTHLPLHWYPRYLSCIYI